MAWRSSVFDRGVGAHGVVPAAASLSWVWVSKSLASWRSCSWLAGSPQVRLTMRPRLHGRALRRSGRSSAARACSPAPAGTRPLRRAGPWPARRTRATPPCRQCVYSAPARYSLLGQVPVEHVELALDLHREAVDRVFDLGRRIGVEVAEAAAQVRRAAHLPEQPRQAVGARLGLAAAGRRRTSRPGTSGSRRTRTRGSASGRCGPPAPGSWSWGWRRRSRCRTARLR